MEKKKYTILIPEVHYSFREVEAENEQEAIEKALDAEETFLEYSHTLDNQFIKIEKESDNGKQTRTLSL